MRTLLVWLLFCCPVWAQGALMVEVEWNKTDLPAWLRHGNLSFRTQAHEVDNPANRDSDRFTPSVNSEQGTGTHQLANFPNDPHDAWMARVWGGSVTITAYGGPYDGEDFTVFWATKSWSNSWTDTDHTFHVTLDYY